MHRLPAPVQQVVLQRQWVAAARRVLRAALVSELAVVGLQAEEFEPRERAVGQPAGLARQAEQTAGRECRGVDWVRLPAAQVEFVSAPPEAKLGSQLMARQAAGLAQRAEHAPVVRLGVAGQRAAQVAELVECVRAPAADQEERPVALPAQRAVLAVVPVDER